MSADNAVTLKGSQELEMRMLETPHGRYHVHDQAVRFWHSFKGCVWAHSPHNRIYRLMSANMSGVRVVFWGGGGRRWWVFS